MMNWYRCCVMNMLCIMVERFCSMMNWCFMMFMCFVGVRNCDMVCFGMMYWYIGVMCRGMMVRRCIGMVHWYRVSMSSCFHMMRTWMN